MTLLNRPAMWVRALLRRRTVESDLDREMALHIEMQTAELVRRGVDPVEAARQAHVAFGGMDSTREAVRDERGTRWLDDLRADLRYTVRGAVARPAFTAAVVTLIALGTGANSAIFSVVDRLVLHPLPFKDADRMVEMEATSGKGGFRTTPSVALIDAWRTRSHLVEDVEYSMNGGGVLGDTARLDAKRLAGSAITPGMFAFAGMQPIKGRGIIPSDTLPGAPPVVILAYALWKREFGGADSILNRTILLDGQPATVVGIAPRGFGVPYGGAGDELFTAVQGGSPYMRDPIAKLKPGVTADAAARELVQIKNALDSEKGTGDPRLTTLEDLGKGSTRPIVLMLFGAVAFVLLVACANVANLLLARAWSRRREFALRATLGASRGRLLRQVFTESLCYALIGGAGGLIVAMVFLKVVIAVQPNIRSIATISTDVWLEQRVLVWTLGVSLATGLLFGMAPAFLTGDRGDALGSSARTTTGSGAARRFRSTLVIVEVALSVVLLVGAGLLVRTLAAMQRFDVGFEPRGMAAFSLQLRPDRFRDSTTRRAVLASVLDDVRRRPGIRTATYAVTLPPDWMIGIGGIEIDGVQLSPADSLRVFAMNVVDPAYFAATGIRVVRGRVLDPDPRLTDRFGSGEVMINERLANRFWPGGNAIGARIRTKAGGLATVVGVVGDVDVPDELPFARTKAQLYFALPGAPRAVSLIVRSPLPILEVRTLVRDAVKSAGGGMRLGGYTTADAEVAHSQAMIKFTLTLLGIFALLALVLAALGLHAVIAYSVSQRTRELGIRMALGAESRAVARLVIGEGVVLGVFGTVVGCGGALIATRLLRAMLFGVEAHDPWTLAAVGAGLLVVSVAASALPAWRAARINPVEMIRAE